MAASIRVPGNSTEVRYQVNGTRGCDGLMEAE